MQVVLFKADVFHHSQNKEVISFAHESIFCAGTYLLLTILISTLAPASTQHTEAYFNGSSYVRLFTPISLQSHTGLSFRTCVGGELFAQHTNTSKISLEVRADGLVFLVVLGTRTYESTLSARLLDNRWYYVSLLYRVDKHYFVSGRASAG
ncbi:hypothetical protein PR048_015902 [Dryococelus australis]|uniref:Laminin G domain-containing protein n=1 Tax=Dryococelus australis TaxID=614101 RepID=A0ABQ9HIE9_9NEOP|nr:hypothetical protein PR048_015902 [Dryococelus australis]